MPYIIHNKRNCRDGSGTQIQQCVQHRSKLTKTRTKRLDTTLNPTHGHDIDQSIAGLTDGIMVISMSPRKVDSQCISVMYEGDQTKFTE